MLRFLCFVAALPLTIPPERVSLVASAGVEVENVGEAPIRCGLDVKQLDVTIKPAAFHWFVTGPVWCLSETEPGKLVLRSGAERRR